MILLAFPRDPSRSGALRFRALSRERRRLDQRSLAALLGVLDLPLDRGKGVAQRGGSAGQAEMKNSRAVRARERLDRVAERRAERLERGRVATSQAAASSRRHFEIRSEVPAFIAARRLEAESPATTR
ncbi:MAG TPA: hypothetical protein VGC00_00605 [Thermoanaerobaculia bacterium]